MSEQRVWTNSRFGRVLAVLFAIFALIVGVGESPDAAWTWDQILVSGGIAVAGAVVLVAMFSSRLTLKGGVLTARHFYGSRSVRLEDVEVVEEAFVAYTGLILRLHDGTTMRTLVSGTTGHYWGKTRAERLCEELGRLALASCQAPGETVSAEHPVVVTRASRVRRVVVWSLLIVGWFAMAALANWWAHRQDIEWALEESGNRGPNFLFVTSLVYWGAVGCVALVMAANAEAKANEDVAS